MESRVMFEKMGSMEGIDGHEEVVDVFEGVQVPWMYGKQNPIRSQFQCR